MTVTLVVYQRVAHARAITASRAAPEREPSSKAASEIQALWEWLYKRLQPKPKRK